uniref:Ig-like domain-containing protein n=1 Tax=Knipowitschia caucasica TaxID=637954 RepID=A0AAV2L9H2_KNICA
MLLTPRTHSVAFLLTVTEPAVSLRRPQHLQENLKCLADVPLVLESEVSRTSARVTWCLDGEPIEPNPNVSISEDGLTRRLTVHCPSTSDSGTYTCGAGDDHIHFHVQVTEPPVSIVRKQEVNTAVAATVGDDVVLECEVSRPDAVTKWFRDGERVESGERVCVEEEGPFRSLVLLCAEVQDSAEYFLDAGDDGISFQVTVREPPVRIVGNSSDVDYQEMVAGDELILACEVSRVDAPVRWFWNDRPLLPDSRVVIQSSGTLHKLIISDIQTSHSGQYVCDALDDRMVSVVRVQESPVTFINKQEDLVLVGFEAESLDLTCYVSRESAAVRWLKDWTPVEGERFRSVMEGHKRTLTLQPLRRSDAGEYTCDAHTDQCHFSLLVKEMRVKFTEPLQDTVAHADGMVTLRCQVGKAKADVQWLRGGQEITPSRRYTIRAEGQERSLTIHRLTRDDAGEYACESKDDRTAALLVVEMPRVVEFLTELHNTTVLEGEDATFKCVVSPEDVSLRWLMDSVAVAVAVDGRITVLHNGLCHTLVIHKCTMTDCARITAEAEGQVSKASLRVQEAQITFTKRMESVMAEEMEDATLQTEVSLDSGEVQWMRQGVVIQAGPHYSLTHEGRTRRLTLHNLTLNDRGTYRCESLHDRTQVKLHVEPRKISVRSALLDQEAFEREAASFQLELSHTDVEGSWQKDGIRVKPSAQVRVSRNGRVHSLTLSGLTLEDTGTIVFTADGLRTSARLTVKETPVLLLLPLADARVEEDTSLTLECEFSRPLLEVKWYKDGKELKPGKNIRIYSMGRKRFCQILQSSTDDSGLYKCESGDLQTSCTLEVYEHKLELVQGLEDLEILEDQNAVFMCSLSLEGVSGDWFKDGSRIRPSATVKIRTEGTKHFLLMCNVKAEDAGEIRFVARDVETAAFLEVEELPVSIVKPLRDRTALEKHRVILECTTSTPRCTPLWFRGGEELLASPGLELLSDGCTHKLVIQEVSVEDEDTYSVQVGEHTSSAKLLVEGQALVVVRPLEDTQVTPQQTASFRCDVSVDINKAPSWSLNGEVLRPGPGVRMESQGTSHTLKLQQPHQHMSGTVRFTLGKAKSCAALTVSEE